MASNSLHNPATDSAETLRDLAGENPTTTFDDPTFVDSNPASNASSETLVASADEDDEDVDEVDFEDDTEEDEEDEEDDLDDEEDDAVEAGAGLRAAAEADDDADDDGRENAVDEDDLDAEAEDDLDEDAHSLLDPAEAEALRSRLAALSIVPLTEVPSTP